MQAMFVEGLGSPCLEYMLCTSASRLAQSQGLHRHPPQGCKMTDDQLRQRSLIFWTIYCYDKHISMRAGRPSVRLPVPGHFLVDTLARDLGHR